MMISSLAISARTMVTRTFVLKPQSVAGAAVSRFSTTTTTDEESSDNNEMLSQMREKISKMREEGSTTLRYNFSDLPDDPDIEISPKVRKLLDLTNGSTREVVKEQKRKGMELFQQREGDTGSSAVQVIALTTRIQQMQAHLAKHRKDNVGKRTLQRYYVRRRKVLEYMERKEFDSYRHVVKTLGLIR